MSRGGLLDRHGRRTSARDRRGDRHDRAGTAPSRRRRARPSSSASPTSRACRSSTSRRCAPSPTRVASRASTSSAARCCGRATCRASPASPATRSASTSSTTRVRVQALDRSNGASIWKQDVLAKRRIGGPQLIGDQVGVVDVEGYLHLLSRTDGAYVGRMATDGSPATTQPAQSPAACCGSPRRGTVYSVTVAVAGDAAHDRPRRPSQRRQVDAVQPADEDARRARRRLPGPDARPALRPRRASASASSSSSTPAASSPSRTSGILHEMAQADAPGDRRGRRGGVHRRRARRARAAGPRHRRAAAQVGPADRARRQQGRRHAAERTRSPSSTSSAWASRCRSRPRTARACAT